MASGDFCGMCGTRVLDIDQKCGSCGADLASTGARRLIGKILLSDYEVLEVLGQGGMAIVYRGRHRVTGQEVALKVLPPEMAAHQEVRSRFVQEARALALLDHPNIVHLYNFDSDDGAFVLAMQLAEGPTWERLILEGKLDWRRSIELAISVCSALEYAHKRGIIHRDMKPSNVCVREPDGAVMVMDFGIAKSASDSRLTATGQTMGTVRYMSPEQVRGKAVDPRSDLYSLAVTIYESVSGQTPFDGETHFELMSAHLKSVALPLSEVAPDCPQALSDLVAWGMRKAPRERPGSASEFAERLTAVLAGETPAIPAEVTRAEPVTRPGRGRVPLMVAAIAVVVLGAGAGVLIATRDGAPTPAPKPSADTRSTKTELPSGASFKPEVTIAASGLRLTVADGIEPQGYVDAYSEGIRRWFQYVRGRKLESDPTFSREFPPARIVVAPLKAICDSGSLSQSRYRECLEVGSVGADGVTLLIPKPINSLPRAIDSFIPHVFCRDSTALCLDVANAYVNEIFLQ